MKPTVKIEREATGKTVKIKPEATDKAVKTEPEATGKAVKIKPEAIGKGEGLPACLCWLFCIFYLSCISERDVRIEPLPPRPVLNALVRPGTTVTANVSVSSGETVYSEGMTRPSEGATRHPASVHRMDANCGRDAIGGKNQWVGGKNEPSGEKNEPSGGKNEPSGGKNKPSGRECLTDGFINDATVELRVNGVLQGRLEKASSPGDYSFPLYHPVAGDRVEMTVYAPSFDPVTAATCVPPRTEIAAMDTVSYRFRDDWGESWEYLDLTLWLRNVPGQRNYYLLSFTPHQLWRKGTEVVSTDTMELKGVLWLDIYSDEDFFLENVKGGESSGRFHSAGASFLFTDDFRKGKPFTLHFTFSNVQYSYRDDTLSCLNTCRVSLRSVSESYYLYRRSKSLQKEQEDILGETGLREPLPTYTNVENGYGLLGAWQEVTSDIVFPFKADTIPYNNPFKPNECHPPTGLPEAIFF